MTAGDDVVMIQRGAQPKRRDIAGVACPACVRGEHEQCWAIDPPPGGGRRPPRAGCPCRVGSIELPRYVVVSGRGPLDLDGWVVFDRADHDSVVGWFGSTVKVAAERVAEAMNNSGATFGGDLDIDDDFADAIKTIDGFRGLR